MIKTLNLILALILLCLICSCKKYTVTASTPYIPTPPDTSHEIHRVKPVTLRKGPPNIIFLLADDMGYEMPTFDGGASYNTSHLDSLAANGMVFTQCRGTPLCSPSRVELLSGVYNFRNYLKYGWAYYDPQFVTYAKLLQNKGYKTCVVGKWQLHFDVSPGALGFNKYCLVDANGNLYKTPTFKIDSAWVPGTSNLNKYSEDIAGDYALNFIHENKDRPFFLYYSFMLIHMPDQPTPLDPNFLTFDESLADTTYIGSMTHYLDLKVGALMNKLKAEGLEKNTIIVFTGDNGSLNNYHSLFKGQRVTGLKGQTYEFGVHVPLFAYWPGHIVPGVNNNLVDFSDFAPTFLDMGGVVTRPQGWDGVSFYPQLFGDNSKARKWTYCYYDPFPVPGAGQPVTQPISFAQDTAYKLYKTGLKSGKFYHFTVDLRERNPLKDSQLTPEEAAIKQQLQAALGELQ